MKRLIYRILSSLSLILGYAFLFLATALLFAHKIKLKAATAQWRPWFASRFKYSTTVGSAIIFNPNHLGDESELRIRAHEKVHIRQFEDDAVFFVLLAAWEVVAFLSPLWVRLVFTVPVLWLLLYVAKWLNAWLRGGHVYRDAEHERSAYAQTDTHLTGGKSWLDDHLSRPRDW